MPHDFVREDTGHIFDAVSDGDLAVLAADGSQEAFSELLNRYTGVMVSKIAGVRPCGMDTSDLMQECSIGLLSAVGSYRRDGGASFRTYAGVCIENRIRSAIRRSSGDKNKPLSGYIELSDYYREVGQEVDNTPDPADSVMIGESVEEMHRRIRKLLSARELEVFELYLTGISYSAMAKTLGVSVKSIDNAMQRIRKKLKDEVLYSS